MIQASFYDNCCLGNEFVVINPHKPGKCKSLFKRYQADWQRLGDLKSNGWIQSKSTSQSSKITTVS